MKERERERERVGRNMKWFYHNINQKRFIYWNWKIKVWKANNFKFYQWHQLIDGMLCMEQFSLFSFFYRLPFPIFLSIFIPSNGFGIGIGNFMWNVTRNLFMFCLTNGDQWNDDYYYISVAFALSFHFMIFGIRCFVPFHSVVTWFCWHIKLIL